MLKSKENFENLILIVSHPDDECLFSSSLLDKIKTLIICFNDIPGELEISHSRKKALKSYPLKSLNLIPLNIKQAKETFFPNNWLNIKDKKSGLIGGYEKYSYDLNYQIILKKLKTIIKEKETIITHNPWGEYGHPEHCQVFKAVFQIAINTNSNLFVNSYVSNLSKYYAKKKIHLLNDEMLTFKTNHKKYELLKEHYSKYGCWTWYKNYKIPNFEFFSKINLQQDPNSVIQNNKILFQGSFIKHRGPVIFFIRSIFRNLLPKFIKNIYRTGILSPNKI